MRERNFRQMLEKHWSHGKFVCIGLDSDLERVPESVRSYEMNPMDKPKQRIQVAATLRAFNKAIVKATKDLVCAYKPNSAFYEEHGPEGIEALHHTIADIHFIAPDVPVILDVKRADIGKSNRGYVRAAFGYSGADAVTVHPYFGAEALRPFLEQKDKGIIVLCRTSNPGAGEFQDLYTLTYDPCAKPNGMTAEEWLDALCEDSMRLYERVALNVATTWNTSDNCLLVVGATYPIETKCVRVRVGDIPFLLPGIGTQGGDVEATVMAARDSRGWGMLISSSSAIIFASSGEDFAEVARRETQKLANEISEVLAGA